MIRIPVECESSSSEAAIRQEDDQPISECVRQKGLVALLDSWKATNDSLPEIEDHLPAPDELF